MDASLAFAAIIGVAVILAVSIYGFARLRIEQERTLQKLIDRGVSGDELIRAAGFSDRGSRDLRRGLLLIGAGGAWSLTTFFIGGTAWIMGAFPIALGLVFVLFRVLDGKSR
jgi:hypothetical protein